MSTLNRRVRRLECRSAADATSLTVVLKYVSTDGSEAEQCRFRYERGTPPMRSDDGGQTWYSPSLR